MTFLQWVVVIRIWHLPVEGILVATILVMAAFLVRLRHRIRRHEDALASAQTRIATAAQWKSIIASMPDGISVVDSDLRLVEWNGHMPEFAGVPSEILGALLELAVILRAIAVSRRGSSTNPASHNVSSPTYSAPAPKNG
jgi:PAS domain-containing protein